MAITDTAPYGTATGITTVLDTFRETGLGGNKITTAFIKRFSMGEEVARRVALSMRLLDLIDDEGVPTKNLLAFKQAPTGEYKKVFANQLYDAYATEFAVLGRDLAGKTKTQIEDAFRHFKPDTLRDRMVTCFLGLCEYAEIIPLSAKAKPGPKPRGAPSVPRQRGQNTPAPPPPPASPPAPPANIALDEARKRYVDLLLTKISEGEPSVDLLDRVERALGIAREKGADS